MNRKDIIMVSLILGMLLIAPMISASSSSSELVKGWNIVEFNQDIDWVDLKFTDGVEVLSITDAGNAGWISSTLKYWGYWKLFEVYTFRFIDASGSFGKSFVSAKEQVLVYSYQDGISIVVDKPNNVKAKPYNPEKKNKRFFQED